MNNELHNYLSRNIINFNISNFIEIIQEHIDNIDAQMIASEKQIIIFI